MPSETVGRWLPGNSQPRINRRVLFVHRRSNLRQSHTAPGKSIFDLFRVSPFPLSHAVSAAARLPRERGGGRGVCFLRDGGRDAVLSTAKFGVRVLYLEENFKIRHKKHTAQIRLGSCFHKTAALCNLHSDDAVRQASPRHARYAILCNVT